MSPESNKKSPRTFQCRQTLWNKFEQMARELECSVDYLINDAMKQYARQRGYTAGGKSLEQADVGSAPPPPVTAGAAPVPPPAGSHSGNSSVSRAVSGSGAHRSPAASGSGLLAHAPPVPVVSAPLPPPHAPTRGAVSLPPPGVRVPVPPPPGARSLPPPHPSATTRSMPAVRAPAPAIAAPAHKPVMSPPPARPATGSQGTPRLSIRYKGQLFTVNKDRFIIGRGKQSSDLTIKDPNVSRQHAMIEFSNGQYSIVDLGSTNGIEYEGQRVQRRPIHDRDRFRVCDHELEFLYQ